MTFRNDFIETLKDLKKLPEVSLKQVSKLYAEKQELKNENFLFFEELISSNAYDLVKDTPEFRALLIENDALREEIEAYESMRDENEFYENSEEIKQIN